MTPDDRPGQPTRVRSPDTDAGTDATRLRGPEHGADPGADATRLRGPEHGADPGADATRLRGPEHGADPGADATRLRQPATDTAAGATRLRAPLAPAAADAGAIPVGPGSLLKGRFEIKALVGRGGMGTVFRAEDRRKLEAHDPDPAVAVKVLNAAFERHPDAFVALQREASKAQSLAHPNIVTVFDFDRDGGSVFLTMELLRGQSLEALIRGSGGNGIGRGAALPLIRGIADGLAYAHRKGIVHSDLKPANIFVLEDGTPKILDFGIARAVPSAARAAGRDRFDAGSLGAYSEGYATAEMVDGADPAPADDLYALGIIVYELLTGRHPFGGAGAIEAQAGHMAPVPIQALRRREWRAVARSLAFDRTERPRDAASFLREFFGATGARNGLIAATAVLGLAAGYLWYRNYQQTGPAVPFEALPAEVRQKITTDIAEGDKAWEFYAREGVSNALSDSLSYFADAYSLHKGDRAAVHGLERAADALLKQQRDPVERREKARILADSSEFLKTYPPVVESAGR